METPRAVRRRQHQHQHQRRCRPRAPVVRCMTVKYCLALFGFVVFLFSVPISLLVRNCKEQEIANNTLL